MPKITGQENKFSTFELKRPDSRQNFNLTLHLTVLFLGISPFFTGRSISLFHCGKISCDAGSWKD